MIKLDQVTLVTQDHLVLDIERLVVASGEIVAVVGPSGSGGETLLRLLTGRLRPTSGAVHIVGQNPADFPLAFSHKVGVVFKNDSLSGNRSTLGNLKFQANLRGRHPGRAEELLTLLELSEQGGSQVEDLSDSQRRRLSFGLALLHDPQVLLLVDPFTRCDEESIALLSRVLTAYAGNGGAVLILAENETNLSTLCHEILILEQGRIAGRRNPQKGGTNTAQPLKISVGSDGEFALISPAAILYATSAESGSRLITQEGAFLSEETLDALEKRLARWGFFRTDSEFVINLQHARELVPINSRQTSLRLDDREGTLIALTKEAARELRALLTP